MGHKIHESKREEKDTVGSLTFPHLLTLISCVSCLSSLLLPALGSLDSHPKLQFLPRPPALAVCLGMGLRSFCVVHSRTHTVLPYLPPGESGKTSRFDGRATSRRQRTSPHRQLIYLTQGTCLYTYIKHYICHAPRISGSFPMSIIVLVGLAPGHVHKSLLGPRAETRTPHTSTLPAALRQPPCSSPSAELFPIVLNGTHRSQNSSQSFYRLYYSEQRYMKEKEKKKTQCAP